jgi:type I restriction enzyme S subunit
VSCVEPLPKNLARYGQDVAWLGSPPDSWSVLKLKYLMTEKSAVKGGTLSPGAISFGEVIQKEMLNEDTLESYQEVRVGEILVNPINLNYDLKSLRVALSAIDVRVSPAYIVLKPSADVDPHYLRWLLYLFDVAHMKTLGAGVRQTITFSEIGECPVCVPPPQEQERIANFLDDKTARIDALIAEKERLVETLNEYEQSTITSAVTKGLNLNAHEVHANEDWLGEIPAHWAQSRVRRVCHRVTDGAHISPDLTSPDFPFVSTVDIAEGTIDFDGCLRASTDCYEYLVKTGCQPKDGDVLFSKDGTIGRTAVVQTGFPDFVVASSLVIVSPCLEKIVPKFLDYWFNNQLLKQYVELQLVGAALRRISVEKVGRLPVLVPPLDEQRAIVRQLDAVTSRIRSLVHHAQEHIARLREYRSSLISAAVTGQLDIGSFKESA